MALTQISTAGVKDDAVTSGKIPANAVGSSELADNAVDTAAIANDAVTFAKMQNTADGVRLLGKHDSGGGQIGEITAAQARTMLNVADGATNSTGTTINNNADNRVITGSGTANTLEGESSLTYSASGDLTQTVSVDGKGIVLNAGNIKPMITGDANRSAAGNTIFGLSGKWNGTEVARIAVEAGSDTTNKDDAKINFYTASAGSISNRMRILPNGRVHITPSSTDYTMNSDSTNLIIGTGGGAVGMTFLTAGAADSQSISFQQNETLSRAEGEIQYGPGSTSTAANRHAMMFRVNSSEKLRIQKDGGISFNGDTATANALDDYEEGSYTATIYGSTTGTGSPFGMNPVALRYTKVGRVVHVTGRVYINSSSNNPTGSARMLLPFTSANNNQGNDGQAYSYISRYNVYSPNNDWNLIFEVEPNSTYGNLLWDKPGTTWANATADGHINQTAAYYGFDFSYTTS